MSATRRSVLQVAGTTTAAVAVGGLGMTSSHAWGPRRARARFAGDPGRGRLYYGASTDRSLHVWERSLGRRVSVHRTFHRPDGSLSLIKAVRTDLQMGRLPHVSTKCPGSWKPWPMAGTTPG